MATVQAFFVDAAVIEDAERKPRFVFEKGTMHELSDASFNFWNSRGKCVTKAEAVRLGLAPADRTPKIVKSAATADPETPKETPDAASGAIDSAGRGRNRA